MSHDIFPEVVGNNLLGERIIIPRDLLRDLNILVIAFQRWQQQWVDSWIPTFENLVTSHPSLEYYELPTIRKMNVVMRKVIDGGMRGGIPSSETRRRTITLYIDKESFKNVLSITKEDSIYLYVVDRTGRIYHRESGPYSVEKESELVEIIQRHLATVQ